MAKLSCNAATPQRRAGFSPCAPTARTHSMPPITRELPVAGASVTTFDRFGDQRGYFNELYNEEKYDGLAAPAQNWKQARNAFCSEPAPSTLSAGASAPRPDRPPTWLMSAKAGRELLRREALVDRRLPPGCRGPLRREGQVCSSSALAGVLLLVPKARAPRAALLPVR